MRTNPFSKRSLAWLAGSLVIGAMALAIASEDLPAQTKTKADSKGPKAGKKADAVPTNFPPRFDSVDSSRGGAAQIAEIDEAIAKGWKANSTFPSDRCTDYEFIRRASLDIIGRIPTVKEVAEFMKHPERSRRGWLISAMLDGKEYGYGEQFADNFANMWTVSLMTRSGSRKFYQAQMQAWLKDQFRGTEESPPDWSKIASALISSTGETNRNQAVNYLLHNLGEEIKQDQGKNGKWDMVPATSRTTKLFLGIRTQCVQCHDHPFNGEWGQHHFWGINAFLRQVDSNGKPPPPPPPGAKANKKTPPSQQFELKDRSDFNNVGLISYERRNAVVLFTDPSFLDSKKIPKSFKGTRREALAKMITASPWFAKAFVNRAWGHFFGKSFTRDNADDFGEHNPVSHPELLDKLSEEWATQYKHNPKDLVRWICNSQAYGLSSKANKWNDKTEDETLFARMLLKPMTPEQMFESMMIATQKQFGADRAAVAANKEAWLNSLVVNFGNDEGEEGSYTGTVVQALLLMNGKHINEAITEKDGLVADIVRKRGASQAALPLAINDMFMSVLSRPPTPREMFAMTNANENKAPVMFRFRPGSKTQPNTPAFWTNYYQDIMWALVNSNEFVLNH